MGSEPSVVSVMTIRQAMTHGLVKNGGSAKHVEQHIDLKLRSLGEHSGHDRMVGHVKSYVASDVMWRCRRGFATAYT
jgi:hypothetical protein